MPLKYNYILTHAAKFVNNNKNCLHLVNISA